jgi:hypothetical protein
VHLVNRTARTISHDPDHTMIELVFHERRPYPPVPKKEPAEAPADQGAGGGAESAD